MIQKFYMSDAMKNHDIETAIVFSSSHNPWHNIAFEEVLLSHVRENQVILYLWQNENTVVIGRHQNVWKECRWKELEEDGGFLARRLSGGGAVYHDLGNLNFTFLAPKKLYNLEKQLRVILTAVQKAGIHAEFTGRNDITVDGQKFSGNAFHRNSHAAFHHGTLLVDADFTRLARYLRPSVAKLRSKGVESVRSRVINLKQLAPELTIDKMRQMMVESFSEVYESHRCQLDESQFENKLAQSYEKFSSWDWRYGKNPDFEIEHTARFIWGGVEIGLTTKNGVITDVRVFSDALQDDFIDKLKPVFLDVAYKNDTLKQTLKRLPLDPNEEQIYSDIVEWVSEWDY